MVPILILSTVLSLDRDLSLFQIDSSKINLTWTGKRAFCAYKTGHIAFGKQFFDRITSNNWKILGYKSEKPYMQRFVSNKEEAAIWAVLHEYTHLFKGYQNHNASMWKELVRIANEESWLWSNPSRA